MCVRAAVVTQEDLANLAAVDAVVGSVLLVADLDDTTGLPAVQVIVGNLVLTAHGPGEVKYAFPLLREINGDLSIRNNVGLLGLDASVASERLQAFPLFAVV